MNDLLVLKKENLNLKGINKKLANEKKLIKEDNYINYLYVQALYKKAFEKYLSLNIDLSIYDKKLSESELDFGIILDERKTVFHKNSYLNLNYIYIRNYFYVEKLSVDYIKIFFERLNNHNYEIDNILLKIVQETYSDVINDNYKHNEYKEDTTTCYGPIIPSNIVNSKSLVLVIQYGRNNKSYTDEEFLINQLKKKQFIRDIAEKMEKEITKILGIESKVLIEY